MKWADFMKIYYFDPESGIYQGEGFADESPLKRNIFRIPEHATTIAPPPYTPGSEVPFFDPEAGKWELREIRLNNCIRCDR
ncbi:MAG TPA: hypothetical protein VFG19_01225 [Geobacteraceae bacterium]|nr:hypothetical protein [Geobacteraceae bacterium]